MAAGIAPWPFSRFDKNQCGLLLTHGSAARARQRCHSVRSGLLNGGSAATSLWYELNRETLPTFLTAASLIGRSEASNAQYRSAMARSNGMGGVGGGGFPPAFPLLAGGRP